MLESLRFIPGQSSKIKSTNPRLTVYRDGIRLGEWQQDEVRKLHAEGLVSLSDHYGRDGGPDLRPLQSLLKPVREPQRSLFSRTSC